MATFTLEDLKQTVEEKYAPTIIKMGEAGDLVLTPTLRLSDDDMATFVKTQREFNALQQDEPEYVDDEGKKREPTDEEAEAYEAEQLKVRPRMVELMEKMIRTVATSDEKAETFFGAVKHDLATYIVTVEKYGKSTQLGEASASPSS